MFNQSATDIAIFSDNNKSVLFISPPAYHTFSELLIDNISNRTVDREY
jgi:hypothetical protein